MLCEMCGNEVPSTSRVRLERTVLNLCPDCARFGEPVDPPPPAAAPPPSGASRAPAGGGASRPGGIRRRLEERDLYEDIGEMELAPDWPRRVRVAREALTWKPEDLAKKLNEKKSIVLKIESGSFRPPDALVHKIEHLLKIRLRAEQASSAPK
jgi:putative transcription factor